MRGFSQAEGRVIRTGLRVAAVGDCRQRRTLRFSISLATKMPWQNVGYIWLPPVRNSAPASALLNWPSRADPRAVAQAWFGYALPTRAERLRPRVDLRGTFELRRVAGRNISDGYRVNRPRASARSSLASTSRGTVQAVIPSRTKRNPVSEPIKLTGSLRRLRHDAVASLQQVVDHVVQGATG